MLPADTIAAITTNLAALQLEPTTAAQILARRAGPAAPEFGSGPAGGSPAKTRRPAAAAATPESLAIEATQNRAGKAKIQTARGPRPRTHCAQG